MTTEILKMLAANQIKLCEFFAANVEITDPLVSDELNRLEMSAKDCINLIEQLEISEDKEKRADELRKLLRV